MSDTIAKINTIIKEAKENGHETEEISDGYHTFKELYECRHALFCCILNSFPHSSWKSRKRSDDTPMYKGWFIAGLNHAQGNQITFHLPEIYWDILDKVNEIEKPPKYGGHDTRDVITRLLFDEQT